MSESLELEEEGVGPVTIAEKQVTWSVSSSLLTILTVLDTND